MEDFIYVLAVELKKLLCEIFKAIFFNAKRKKLSASKNDEKMQLEKIIALL